MPICKLSARLLATGQLKKVASKGKNLGKMATVKSKKAAVEELGVADLLQDQLVAIQATNEHILTRLQHLEQRQVPIEEPQRRGYRLDCPESPVLAQERRGYRPDRSQSPVQAQARVEPPAPFSRDDGDAQVQQFIHHLEEQEQEQFSFPGMGDRAVQRFKSGQFRIGGEIPCRKFVIWPHDLCYVGVDCKRILYNDMSSLQWSCGFVRSVLKQPSAQVQLNMLTFAAEFFQNALDLGWPIARGGLQGDSY